MGLLEFLCVALSFAPCAVAGVVLWKRRSPPAARSPLPLAPTLAALVLALLGLSFGFLGGGALWELAVPLLLGEGAPLAVRDPAAAFGASVSFRFAVAMWFALPGLGGLGWLLLSRQRSLGLAGLFAGLLWLGFTLGLPGGALAVRALLYQPMESFAGSMLLDSLSTSFAAAMLATGAAGGSALGLIVIAWRAGPFDTLAAVAAASPVVTASAALLTPPDIVSLAALLTLDGAAVVVGVGLGAVLRLVLPPSPQDERAHQGLEQEPHKRGPDGDGRTDLV